MASRAWRDPLLLLALLALAPGVAHAQAPLAITSETACPSAEDVGAELPEASPPLEGEDAWRVSIERSGARVVVTLHRPGGEPAGARTFRSRDCSALAAVIAEIVRAQLVELRVWTPAPPPLEPEPDPETSEPDAPELENIEPHEPHEPLEPPADPPSPGPAPALAEDRSAARSLVRIALAGGLRTESEGPRWAGLGTLTLSVAPLGPLLVRARFVLASPLEVGAQPDRVRMTTGGARLGLGLRSHRDVIELDAALELGIDLSHVAALDLELQPSEVRVLPAVGLAAGAALALAGPLSLRLDAVATIPLLVERYVVEPDGELARSAPFVFDLTLGLELAL